MNKKLEFFSSMVVAFIVLILVFLCIRFSGQGKFATHGGTNPSDVKCIYTSVWPYNEYTRLICEPESGTIEYIYWMVLMLGIMQSFIIISLKKKYKNILTN